MVCLYFIGFGMPVLLVIDRDQKKASKHHIYPWKSEMKSPKREVWVFAFI